MSQTQEQLDAARQIFHLCGQEFEIDALQCDICIGVIAGRKCARCHKDLPPDYAVHERDPYCLLCINEGIGELNAAREAIIDALMNR